MARRWKLERRQRVPAGRTEVFSFFSDVGNLERITPDALGFRILTKDPAPVRQGAVIKYVLRLYGFPMKWVTLIEVFEPENRFVDVQIRGPYRYWRHHHSFKEVEGGTEIEDVVEYELPFGILGSAAHTLFVRRTLERIFAYRKKAIARIFGAF